MKRGWVLLPLLLAGCGEKQPNLVRVDPNSQVASTNPLTDYETATRQIDAEADQAFTQMGEKLKAISDKNQDVLDLTNPKDQQKNASAYAAAMRDTVTVLETIAAKEKGLQPPEELREFQSLSIQETASIIGDLSALAEATEKRDQKKIQEINQGFAKKRGDMTKEKEAILAKRGFDVEVWKKTQAFELKKP